VHPLLTGIARIAEYLPLTKQVDQATRVRRYPNYALDSRAGDPGSPCSMRRDFALGVWYVFGNRVAEAIWTASTRANANQTTGLPNSYGV
jgi:hypothetical protein